MTHKRLFLLAGTFTLWVALAAALCAGLSQVRVLASSSTPAGGDPAAGCRFGVDVPNNQQTDFTLFNTGMLHAGWQMDWMTAPTPPLASLEYVNTIILQPKGLDYTATPTGTALAKLVLARPGAMWLVGNEPDCTGEDNLRSGVYARAYHDVYYRIKAIDPTARLGAGSIVQPTPLRIHYLNNVLAAYQQRYGEPLPTDFWATHSHILSEVSVAGEVRGCTVPDWPNDSPEATHYSYDDHWRLDIFESRLINLRRWMADHGYRDRPLIITEYGILFWPDDAATTQRDINFMTGSFDWLTSATDPNIGYPPDGNRLVQRWAWFSLTYANWAPPLFDPQTYLPTAVGHAYGAYTTAHPPAPADLQLSVQAGQPQHGPGGAYTVTLTAEVSNAGDITTTAPISVTFIDSANNTTISQQEIGLLSGCGTAQNVHTEWQGLNDGWHPFCIRVASADLTGTVCDIVRINPKYSYLPLINR
jgi:hypothetical protein